MERFLSRSGAHGTAGVHGADWRRGDVVARRARNRPLAFPRSGKAMKELEAGKGKTYTSAAEMMRDLGV